MPGKLTQKGESTQVKMKFTLKASKPKGRTGFVIKCFVTLYYTKCYFLESEQICETYYGVSLYLNVNSLYLISNATFRIKCLVSVCECKQHLLISKCLNKNSGGQTYRNQYFQNKYYLHKIVFKLGEKVFEIINFTV